MSLQPLKRNPSLQQLSHEHHDGLMLCFKIRQGIKAQVDCRRISRYVNWFAGHHLDAHFLAEENQLLPMVADEAELVQRTISEHKRLRTFFYKDDLTESELLTFAKLLDDHIRFEERILFQKIQELKSESEILNALQQTGAAPVCEKWVDEFWLGKK